MWKEIVVENWNHFNDITSKFTSKDWIFRGQCSCFWDLETSLYRECRKYLTDFNNATCKDIEKKMCQEFLSSYKLYSTYHIKESLNSEDTKEWLEEKISTLSSMQHYGTPTRLLDWTYSPYIATFFALDGASSDFCIYALNTKHLEMRTSELTSKRSKSFEQKFQLSFLNLPKQYEIPFVYPYEPFEKNERIRKQQGLFLVPSVIDMTINEILETYGIEEGKINGEDVAIKLVFKGNNINEWWFRLKQMNITHETIYPGLEGFCKSLKLNLINV
ncbi:MAG: FRG domain-containing protein [Bacillota bacterium]|nr:FRG domain-containing protein [Bacillota bacterium]